MILAGQENSKLSCSELYFTARDPKQPEVSSRTFTEQIIWIRYCLSLSLETLPFLQNVHTLSQAVRPKGKIRAACHVLSTVGVAPHSTNCRFNTALC